MKKIIVDRILPTLLFLWLVFTVVFGIISLLKFFLEDKKPTAEQFYPTYSKDIATIRWVSDPLEVSKKLTDEEIRYGYRGEDGFRINSLGIGGHAEHSFFGDCTVWAYEPRSEDDKEYMRYLGHEMMHCFRGSFHEQQNGLVPKEIFIEF